MNAASSIVELEANWLDRIMQFRFHFPDLTLCEIVCQDGISERVQKMLHQSGDRDDWRFLLKPTVHPETSKPGKTLNGFDLADRLIISIGISHKLLPGFLDRKIHQYFFHMSREPVAIHRTVMGVKLREDSVVPTFTLFAYLYCGNSISERMQVYSKLRKKEFQSLNREMVFPGERDMDEPLFSNELILADDFAFELLDA